MRWNWVSNIYLTWDICSAKEHAAEQSRELSTWWHKCQTSMWTVHTLHSTHALLFFDLFYITVALHICEVFSEFPNERTAKQVHIQAACCTYFKLIVIRVGLQFYFVGEKKKSLVKTKASVCLSKKKRCLAGFNAFKFSLPIRHCMQLLLNQRKSQRKTHNTCCVKLQFRFFLL